MSGVSILMRNQMSTWGAMPLMTEAIGTIGTNMVLVTVVLNIALLCGSKRDDDCPLLWP